MKTKDQGLYMQQSNRKWKPRAEITPLVWWKPVTLNENLGPNVHTTSSAYTPLWDENLKPQGIYRLKFWTTAMGWKPISKEDPRYESGMNFRDELMVLEGPAYVINPSAPNGDTKECLRVVIGLRTWWTFPWQAGTRETWENQGRVCVERLWPLTWASLVKITEI